MPVTGFFDPPVASRYALRRVHVPASILSGPPPGPVDQDDLVHCDLVIEHGKVGDVAAAGSIAPELGPDLDRSLVLPGMLDAHAHLDKGHIVPRARNQTGDLLGAAAASGPDRRARWHAEDVRRRLEFGLQTAYAKGVVAIRSHLDLAGAAALDHLSGGEAAARGMGRTRRVAAIDHLSNRHLPRRTRAASLPTRSPIWVAISGAARASWRRCRLWCRPNSTWRWNGFSPSPRSAG